MYKQILNFSQEQCKILIMMVKSWTFSVLTKKVFKPVCNNKALSTISLDSFFTRDCQKKAKEYSVSNFNKLQT